MGTYTKNQEMVDELLDEANKHMKIASEWLKKSPPQGQSRNHIIHMHATNQGMAQGLTLGAQMICEHPSTSLHSNPADTVTATVCDECNKTLDVD